MIFAFTTWVSSLICNGFRVDHVEPLVRETELTGSSVLIGAVKILVTRVERIWLVSAGNRDAR